MALAVHAYQYELLSTVWPGFPGYFSCTPTCIHPTLTCNEGESRLGSQRVPKFLIPVPCAQMTQINVTFRDICVKQTTSKLI